MLSLTSCTSTSVKEKKYEPTKNLSAWQVQVHVHDKIKDKNNSVQLDVIGLYPKKLRMDISAILGIYVGSFAWNDQEMQMLLAREKKFISGKANRESMQELLKLPLDPVVLSQLFWDQKLGGSDWKCSLDSNLHPQKCEQADLKIQIEFKERTPDTRIVMIDSPKIEAEMNIQKYQKEIHTDSQTFLLTAPENFSVIRLSP